MAVDFVFPGITLVGTQHAASATLKLHKSMNICRFLYFMLLIVPISACAIVDNTASPAKIALLAPFEGRYRSIGYDALYAARLAITESNTTDIVLLAIDDGGTPEFAIDRAAALAKDPAIKIVLLLGIYATQPEVQLALHDKPALIIGEWGSAPIGENSYWLASKNAREQLTVPPDLSLIQLVDRAAPLIGGDMLALPQISQLRASSENQNITILSSSTLPDDDFRERYINSAIFVPEPGLLATLMYDATALSIQSLQTGLSLSEIDYTGINGRIRFDNNIWQNAPINRYRYAENGQLIPQNSQ